MSPDCEMSTCVARATLSPRMRSQSLVDGQFVPAASITVPGWVANEALSMWNGGSGGGGGGGRCGGGGGGGGHASASPALVASTNIPSIETIILVFMMTNTHRN